MEGSCRLQRNYWRARAGNWKYWPTLSLLDEGWKRGCIHHRPGLRQLTVWKLDDFGGESCHGVWSRDHRMGGRHRETGGRKRHTGCRVEPSGHVAGGQRAGCTTLARAGKGKGIPGSGEHRRRRREWCWVVPRSTGQGTRCHCKGNMDLRLVKKMVEWWDQSEGEPAGKTKEEEVQISGDSPGQGWIAEVNSESKRQDVEWLPQEPEGSWGKQRSKVYQPAGSSNRGGPVRQRWETGA